MLYDKDENNVLTILLIATPSQQIDKVIELAAVDECDEIDKIAQLFA